VLSVLIWFKTGTSNRFLWIR